VLIRAGLFLCDAQTRLPKNVEGYSVATAFTFIASICGGHYYLRRDRNKRVHCAFNRSAENITVC